ncbi:hypothetical protein [Cellulophaga baltica]|uniref:hypothetical protein n=1 Tax=Cellulophaga baltica TaxID=76594 RepID=UPI002494D27B|nr:hypothetical protein [Cellulophaga baltica]
MKKLILLTILILISPLYGCSDHKTPFLDCASQNFKSLNLEAKTELKRLEDVLIKEKIIEDNSAESYRILFSKVFSMNNEKEFGILEFDYKAEKLTKVGVMDKCQTILDFDFKKSYEDKMESIMPKLKEIGITVPGAQSEFLLKSLKEIPLYHFEKVDNQFYILFKAYSFGCLTKNYY